MSPDAKRALLPPALLPSMSANGGCKRGRGHAHTSPTPVWSNKGDSRDSDIGRLAHVMCDVGNPSHHADPSPWFDYVRSQSNVADLPSRFELEQLLDLIPPYVPPLPLRVSDPPFLGLGGVLVPSYYERA
eukprot:scaffold10206_cov100-Isochrysis_galbana.AAC.4